jgi:hypothetical protein
MSSRPASPAAELDRAAAFLLARQDADGAWRDYALEPGASDAWTTSVVGLALDGLPGTEAAVGRARSHVRALCRPDGWGYNGRTACDADTTAHAVRFAGGDPALLERWLDAEGNAHTFQGERFGSWAWAHVDVTAAVGLALAEPRRVRSAVLAARGDDGLWQAFWWATPAYATARALELLRTSGGVPSDVEAGAAAWLASAGAAVTAFEAAQRVDAAVAAGLPSQPHVDALLRLQLADGGWPVSAALLVPSQADGRPGPPRADVARLHTSACAVAALRRAAA